MNKNTESPLMQADPQMSDEERVREIVDAFARLVKVSLDPNCTPAAAEIAQKDVFVIIVSVIADAREETKEKCAKIADQRVWSANDLPRASDVEYGGSEVAAEIASAIRSSTEGTPHEKE